ncbi:MAG: hypothetical protein EAZ62_08140 [Sphingobacteriia bacterium]|nr:MAG: hypothetical protein EAZ62_08140 [Sphingobacteriia bacterium]
MKTKLILLFVLVAMVSGIQAQSIPQSTETVQYRSFEDMGYRNESIIGITGAITYFIKLKPKDDVNNSKLILRLHPSQVLNSERSAVTVSLKDEPVYTERMGATAVDSIMTLVIPLDKRYVQEDGRFIKVRVDAKMAMSDEFCQDVDNPAVWMTVRNNSFIAAQKFNEVNFYQSLKETILAYDRISTPNNADLDEMLCGGVLFALIKEKRSLYEAVADNFTQADTLNNTIIAAKLRNLPEYIKQLLPPLQPGQGVIHVVNPYGDNRQIMVVTGADDEGFKKAMYTLTSYKIINSSFTYRMVIDKAEPNYFNKNELPVVFSLEDLGGLPKLMEGIGALKTNYAFSLADYNAIPQKLTFHLEAMMSMLKPGDRGFLNVYLNENLVFTTDLRDQTSFIGDIELKPYLLTKNNSLVVEMRFHGAGSICKEGFSNFFGFIDNKTSNLVFSGEKKNDFMNFFNYPGEFRRKPLKVLVSPNLMKEVSSSLGLLLKQMNTVSVETNYMYIPQMASTDKATMADLQGFNVIALVHRNDPYIKNFNKALPIQFNRDFQLYKGVSGETSYSINDFTNSGIAQIFKQDGTTFLVVTCLGDTMVNAAFEGVIKVFGSQFSSIESNVCIANSSGRSNFFFKLPTEAIKTRWFCSGTTTNIL